jgi:hypothetical protein
MTNFGKTLAVSAILGVLGAAAAACGGASADAKPATTDPNAGSPTEKHHCGNHDGGSCGAMDTTTKDAPKSP